MKDICCLPSASKVVKLLSTYKWNKEKLLADFFSGTAMISEDEDSNEDDTDDYWVSECTDPVECPICMDTLPESATHALSCGHRYCHDCWSGYLTVSLKGKGFSLF